MKKNITLGINNCDILIEYTKKVLSFEITSHIDNAYTTKIAIPYVDKESIKDLINIFLEFYQ